MERIEYSRNEYAAEAITGHYGRTPLAYVRSFGCQQSVNDGERMKGVLQDIGFELADEPDEADLILFNTCAVREHAEQRVFGNIGALKSLKVKNPGLLIGLCGCMAEEEGTVTKLRKSYPFVDMVLGVDSAAMLPEVLVQKFTTRKKALRLPPRRDEMVEAVPTLRESLVKAFLPIMYGCDNFCSYCIVPYVRGREHSRVSADILREFEQLVAEGYKEITLLGQNVNSYGKGLAEKIDFSDLLALLSKTPGDYKIRFLTSHPKDATRKMVDTIAASPNIAKHLHLPVQSGSNVILSKMNRRYSVEEYQALIRYAKETCPEMTFSSDIIVGFPGETPEDFEKTVELVQQVGYTQLFTFIYSKRSGTKAALLPDDTPHKEKADRIGRLKKVQEECVAKVAEKWIGKTFTALVEGPGREEDTMAGRLDNNMLVEFEGDESLCGTFQKLRVTELKNAMLKGEMV